MAKISFTFSGCSWRPFSLSSDIDVTSCFLGPAQAGPCIWGNRALVTTSRRCPRRPERFVPSIRGRRRARPDLPILGSAPDDASRGGAPLPLYRFRNLRDVAVPFLEEGRDDVLGYIVLQPWDNEVRGDRAVFRVQVQEAKVPPGDRLKLIEIGRHFTIRLGDFAQDFPQGLHLLAELPHVVLEVAFAQAHSPSNRRGLKSPRFASELDVCP